MRKYISILIICSMIIIVSGCAMSPTPLTGFILTDINYPHNNAVIGEGNIGFKKGESTATSFLGLVAAGDASVEAAAKNGGITKIKTIDHNSFNVLGLFAKYTTIVTGE